MSTSLKNQIAARDQRVREELQKREEKLKNQNAARVQRIRRREELEELKNQNTARDAVEQNNKVGSGSDANSGRKWRRIYQTSDVTKSLSNTDGSGDVNENLLDNKHVDTQGNEQNTTPTLPSTGDTKSLSNTDGSGDDNENLLDNKHVHTQGNEQNTTPTLPSTDDTKSLSDSSDDDKPVAQISENRKLVDLHTGQPGWNKRQGTEGFTNYVTDKMEGTLVNKEFKLECLKHRPLFAYQKVIEYLVHPHTNINRFLVVHNTGTGKTRSMLRILNNFFFDPRPKLVIVPTNNIKNQFLKQLMMDDNLYSKAVLDHFKLTKYEELFNKKGELTSEKLDLIQKFLDMVKTLHKIKNPTGGLYAPLTVIRYSIAGGTQILNSGRPKHRIFKNKNYCKKNNPYSDKIVIMDEYHNLIKPGIETEKNRIKALKKALYKAVGSVITGFTATPVDGVLKQIKGREYKEANDEGFVSYYFGIPKSIYPDVLPGPPDRVLPYIHLVQLAGENLKAYDKKRNEYAKKSLGNGVYWRKLQNYCNNYTYFSSNLQLQKSNIRKDPYSYCNKLSAIHDLAVGNNQKTVIILHKNHGFTALENVFRVSTKIHKTQKLSATLNKNLREFKGQEKDNFDDHIHWMSLGGHNNDRHVHLLQKFNSEDNNRGQIIKIALVDAKYFSEGVEFYSVRQLFLADIPLSYEDYLQKVGRVMRSCVYQTQLHKTPKEQNVTFNMVVATHPDSKIRTSDMHFLDKLKKSLKSDFSRSTTGKLRQIAVDKKVLEKFTTTRTTYPDEPPIIFDYPKMPTKK
jgi:superfamily II DNA or RNA helicase